MRGIHWLVALLFMAVALLAFEGCGGGGGAASSGVGAVRGFLFKNAATGGPMVGRTSALPSGAASAWPGATVTVTTAEGTASTTTGADGEFIVRGLRPGSAMMRFGPPPGAADILITVLPDVTITVGEPPLTRQQANALVNQEVAKIASLQDVLILSPQQPAPAGVVTESSLLRTTSPDANAEIMRTTSEQWIYFVDLMPGSRFSHPVRYYFVDAQTGQLTVKEGDSWPRFNRFEFYDSAAVNLSSPDAVVIPSRLAGPATSKLRIAAASRGNNGGGRNHVPGCPNPITYSFIVQGTQDANFANDNQQFRQLFSSGGIPGQFIISEFAPPTNPRESVTPASVIDAFNRAAAPTTHCDTFILSIIAHSGTNASGQRKLVMDRRVRQNPEEGNGDGFDGSIFDLRKVKACHIIVILDTCNAGQLVESFASQLRGRRGLEWLVMTSTDANTPSKGDRGGGLFMRGLVSARDELASINTGTSPAVAFGRMYNRLLDQPFTYLGETKPLRDHQAPMAVGETPAGQSCGVDLYLRTAVDLRQGSFFCPAGTYLSLSRIQGGNLYPADEHCDGDHFHAADPAVGITVDGKGPFPESDAMQRGCGFGMVVSEVGQ